MNENFYTVNADIMTIAVHARKNGWNKMSVWSIQRIIYLSKVLYSFNSADENIFNDYHFTVTIYGPYSETINKSIVFLISTQRLKGEDSGDIQVESSDGVDQMPDYRIKWIDTILLILSKYGEEKIFSFIIKDPLYDNYVKTNNLTSEIDATLENKTLDVLNDFKKAFEDTLKDASCITKEEYISLYFDYIFSIIIKA